MHVGGAGVPGCADKQDWAGAELLDLIDQEGLYLLNREKVCKGVVTRIDPRYGTKSTLDLAICNEFMMMTMSLTSSIMNSLQKDQVSILSFLSI